jgi:hypothetical protein
MADVTGDARGAALRVARVSLPAVVADRTVFSSPVKVALSSAMAVSLDPAAGNTMFASGIIVAVCAEMGAIAVVTIFPNPLWVAVCAVTVTIDSTVRSSAVLARHNAATISTKMEEVTVAAILSSTGGSTLVTISTSPVDFAAAAMTSALRSRAWVDPVFAGDRLAVDTKVGGITVVAISPSPVGVAAAALPVTVDPAARYTVLAGDGPLTIRSEVGGIAIVAVRPNPVVITLPGAVAVPIDSAA